MGDDVREVVGMTEEKLLRAAALERLATVTDFLEPLGANEFTTSDTVEWYKSDRAKAARELTQLVKSGMLVWEWRMDMRAGRRVKGYRFVD